MSNSGFAKKFMSPSQVASAIAFCLIVGIAIYHLPHLSAYRHLQVGQTKSFGDGASMSIDDVWTVRFADKRFLRVLCHWSNGFPPDKYWMKATLRESADGPNIEKNFTWYVPMPKTAMTPKGVTPFYWEVRIPSNMHGPVCLQVDYGSGRRIDFNLPCIGIERDSSVPDYFASSF